MVEPAPSASPPSTESDAGADLDIQVIASGAAIEPIGRVVAGRVICADGGLAVARAAGRTVDLVVGDLDSADPDDLAAARAAGTMVDRHPAAKDESDLELAMAAASAAGATRITVHLAAGGRLDHQIANLAVLCSGRWSTAAVAGWVGHDQVWVVRDRLVLPRPRGATVAIQAMGGPARVTTEGLRYPLVDEILDPTEARGIANVVDGPDPTIRVHEGVVLVMGGQPGSAQAV